MFVAMMTAENIMYGVCLDVTSMQRKEVVILVEFQHDYLHAHRLWKLGQLLGQA